MQPPRSLVLGSLEPHERECLRLSAEWAWSQKRKSASAARSKECLKRKAVQHRDPSRGQNVCDVKTPSGAGGIRDAATLSQKFHRYFSIAVGGGATAAVTLTARLHRASEGWIWRLLGPRARPRVRLRPPLGTGVYGPRGFKNTHTLRWRDRAIPHTRPRKQFRMVDRVVGDQYEWRYRSYRETNDRCGQIFDDGG